jgi:hypothetical protein
MPDQFYALTPGELYDLEQGYRVREEAEWQRAAWMVHWIIKPHLKAGKAPTPLQLLGKEKTNDPKKLLDQFTSQEGKDTAFMQLWSKHERQLKEREAKILTDG